MNTKPDRTIPLSNNSVISRRSNGKKHKSTIIVLPHPTPETGGFSVLRLLIENVIYTVVPDMAHEALREACSGIIVQEGQTKRVDAWCAAR